MARIDCRVCEADLEQGSWHITVTNEAGGLIFCGAGIWGVPGGPGEGEDGARGAESCPHCLPLFISICKTPKGCPGAAAPSEESVPRGGWVRGREISHGTTKNLHVPEFLALLPRCLQQRTLPCPMAEPLSSPSFPGNSHSILPSRARAQMCGASSALLNRNFPSMLPLVKPSGQGVFVPPLHPHPPDRGAKQHI